MWFWYVLYWYLLSLLWQEPVLVFPESFMGILTTIPTIPRPLRSFDLDRCKKLVQLASLLIASVPTASTERTVNYLLKLCNQNPAAAVDPLPDWVGWPKGTCPTIWLCLNQTEDHYLRCCLKWGSARVWTGDKTKLIIMQNPLSNSLEKCATCTCQWSWLHTKVVHTGLFVIGAFGPKS